MYWISYRHCYCVLGNHIEKVNSEIYFTWNKYNQVIMRLYKTKPKENEKWKEEECNIMGCMYRNFFSFNSICYHTINIPKRDTTTGWKRFKVLWWKFGNFMDLRRTRIRYEIKDRIWTSHPNESHTYSQSSHEKIRSSKPQVLKDTRFLSQNSI